jgi:hypothetical protein
MRYVIKILSVVSPKKWKNILSDDRTNNILIDDGFYINLGSNEIPSNLLTPRIIYNHLVLEKIDVSKSNERYTNDFDIDTKTWKEIYKNLHNSKLSNKVKETCYKIFHGYLATNTYLYKVGIKNSPRCSLCFLENESIVLLMSECLVVKNFWFRAKEYIDKKYNFDFKITTKILIFGIQNKTKNRNHVNDLLHACKSYIFTCTKVGKTLNFQDFLSRYEVEMQ